MIYDFVQGHICWIITWAIGGICGRAFLLGEILVLRSFQWFCAVTLTYIWPLSRSCLLNFDLGYILCSIGRDFTLRMKNLRAVNGTTNMQWRCTLTYWTGRSSTFTRANSQMFSYLACIIAWHIFQSGCLEPWLLFAMKNMLVHVLQNAKHDWLWVGYTLLAYLYTHADGCGYCDEAQAYLFELVMEVQFTENNL